MLTVREPVTQHMDEAIYKQRCDWLMEEMDCRHEAAHLQYTWMVQLWCQMLENNALP